MDSGRGMSECSANTATCSRWTAMVKCTHITHNLSTVEAMFYNLFVSYQLLGCFGERVCGLWQGGCKVGGWEIGWMSVLGSKCVGYGRVGDGWYFGG